MVWDTLYGDRDGATSGHSCSCPLTGADTSSACICVYVVNGVSTMAVPRVLLFYYHSIFIGLALQYTCIPITANPRVLECVYITVYYTFMHGYKWRGHRTYTECSRKYTSAKEMVIQKT